MFRSCLTLKMEALRSFETSVTVYHTTWRQIAEVPSSWTLFRDLKSCTLGKYLLSILSHMCDTWIHCVGKLPEFLIGTYSHHCAVKGYLEFIVCVLESATVWCLQIGDWVFLLRCKQAAGVQAARLCTCFHIRATFFSCEQPCSCSPLHCV